LCEKPFTANAAEAQEIADLTAASDRVVMEAFHYRYHPLALRVEELVASGELGTLQRVETALCFPLPKFSDIRYNYGLAGGATMDAVVTPSTWPAPSAAARPRKWCRRPRSCVIRGSTAR
jgi:predicted dehydrogenase